jgi:hypothetical protein
MVLMPIYSNVSSKFSYTISLDGINYKFHFHYNYRESFWYMDIADANDNIIRANFKLVTNYSLLTQWRAYSVPVGDLVVLNIFNTSLSLDDTNIGQDYQLIYFTAAELASGVSNGI